MSSSVLEKTFLKDWSIKNLTSPVAAMFMTNQHQRNNTCTGIHMEHHCQFGFLFCISQEEVWSQLTNRLTTDIKWWQKLTLVICHVSKMKTTLANFLCQIISNFIRVRIFIFTRFGGQNIYFLCLVVRNPDKNYRERTDTLQNKHAFKVNAPSYILFSHLNTHNKKQLILRKYL